MAKQGYFLDEDTFHSIVDVLLALRCLQVLSTTAECDFPADEIKAMLKAIFDQGGNNYKQAEYGAWVKQASE